MIYITKNWYEILKEEFEKPYFKTLQNFLSEEYKNYTIYPEFKNIFASLNYVKYEDVKVVIIGQDPYINPNQAHGLCFSVEKTPPPPSLQNIFKELKSDLGLENFKSGNLTGWAKQGVLLLNSVLTVRAGNAFSHKGKGWETFTNVVIKTLAKRSDPIVFLVWGAGARSVIKDIDLTNHHVLYAAHPSPLSAYNGFFGCKHFSQTNDFLIANNKSPIDWQVNE